jgi:hypothetical protein
MGSFLYPRSATISRPAPGQTAGGLQGYGGRTEAAETIIAEGVPCSVQARREGTRNPPGLPADGNKASWRIMTPLGAVADGFVCDNDVFTDDLGRRYGVLADYTNSLGGCFYCERLEP